MNKTLFRSEESAGAVMRRCTVNQVFEKLRKIHREIPVLEPFFNDVSGLEICSFVKK